VKIQLLYHQVQTANCKDLWNCEESFFGIDYKLIMWYRYFLSHGGAELIR